MTEAFENLLRNMSLYLAGLRSAPQIVRDIDDFVSDDHVYQLSENDGKAVHVLQDSTALYVHDPVMRLEHNGYFGDHELQGLIREFLTTYKAT